MTLIIAAEGEEFIIVGSDSLGTYGGTSGTNVCVSSNKLFKITNHVIILIAGDGDIGHELIKKFKQALGTEEGGVSDIANQFISFCRKEFELLKYFPISSNLIPDCAFIIAGLDKQEGIYNIPKSYVAMSYDNFMLRSDELGYKIQGKPMIAHYLFKKYYKDPIQKSANNLASLVYGVLYDIIEVANDGEVGGDIMLAKITSDEIIYFDEQQKEEFKMQWIENTALPKTNR